MFKLYPATMAKTPPLHQELPPDGRASKPRPAPPHYAIEPAYSGRYSRRGRRIKHRASSLRNRVSAGLRLAGDGGSVHAPPARAYAKEAARLAAEATRMAARRNRGGNGVHGPWWRARTPCVPWSALAMVSLVATAAENTSHQSMRAC